MLHTRAAVRIEATNCLSDAILLAFSFKDDGDLQSLMSVLLSGSNEHDES